MDEQERCLGSTTPSLRNSSPRRSALPAAAAGARSGLPQVPPFSLSLLRERDVACPLYNKAAEAQPPRSSTAQAGLGTLETMPGADWPGRNVAFQRTSSDASQPLLVHSDGQFAGRQRLPLRPVRPLAADPSVTDRAKRANASGPALASAGQGEVRARPPTPRRPSEGELRSAGEQERSSRRASAPLLTSSTDVGVDGHFCSCPLGVSWLDRSQLMDETSTTVARPRDTGSLAGLGRSAREIAQTRKSARSDNECPSAPRLR